VVFHEEALYQVYIPLPSLSVFLQLTKQKDESQREKDGMVVKFAQAEQRNIELSEKLQKAETALKDSATEKENLTTYLNSLRSDKQKLKELLEKRVR